MYPIKKLVKQLDPNDKALKDTQKLFPKLSKEIIEAGVFVGPRVKRLIDSDTFPEKLFDVERAALTSFVSLVNFLSFSKKP